MKIKTINEFKEANEGVSYDVIQLGGSIGSKTIHSKSALKDMDAPTDLYTQDEAKEKAKRMNKNLSPGEKNYYGIKYVVAEVVDGKYTGK